MEQWDVKIECYGGTPEGPQIGDKSIVSVPVVLSVKHSSYLRALSVY